MNEMVNTRIILPLVVLVMFVVAGLPRLASNAQDAKPATGPSKVQRSTRKKATRVRPRAWRYRNRRRRVPGATATPSTATRPSIAGPARSHAATGATGETASGEDTVGAPTDPATAANPAEDASAENPPGGEPLSKEEEMAQLTAQLQQAKLESDANQQTYEENKRLIAQLSEVLKVSVSAEKGVLRPPRRINHVRQLPPLTEKRNELKYQRQLVINQKLAIAEQRELLEELRRKKAEQESAEKTEPRARRRRSREQELGR